MDGWASPLHHVLIPVSRATPFLAGVTRRTIKKHFSDSTIFSGVNFSFYIRARANQDPEVDHFTLFAPFDEMMMVMVDRVETTDEGARAGEKYRILQKQE